MRRGLGLVAVWAAAATAAVAVGFGAASLVGDPFTDPEADRFVLGGRSALVGPSGSPPSSPPGSPAGSPPASSPPASSPPASSPPATAEPGRGATVGPALVRTLTTRGGLVSASCRAGQVTVGTSPAVGWEVDDVVRQSGQAARVRFEATGEGEGRVDVEVLCAGGRPRFAVRNSADG